MIFFTGRGGNPFRWPQKAEPKAQTGGIYEKEDTKKKIRKRRYEKEDTKKKIRIKKKHGRMKDE